MKIELKPCPFCGGEVYLAIRSNEENHYRVYHYDRLNCPLEYARLRICDKTTLENAGGAWNRRVDNERVEE